MKDNFDKAFEMVIGLEGKPSDDPDDSGGFTIWGLAKKWHPEVDRNTPIEYAKKVYRVQYWDKVGGDDIPYPVDMIAFDTAVNMGVSLARKLSARCSTWQDYLIQRLQEYDHIVTLNPRQSKFINGWRNRVDYLRKRFENE